MTSQQIFPNCVSPAPRWRALPLAVRRLAVDGADDPAGGGGVLPRRPSYCEPEPMANFPAVPRVVLAFLSVLTSYVDALFGL
jgi:hypothetical protein